MSQTGQDRPSVLQAARDYVTAKAAPAEPAAAEETPDTVQE